jgi:hypothetical protein
MAVKAVGSDAAFWRRHNATTTTSIYTMSIVMTANGIEANPLTRRGFSLPWQMLHDLVSDFHELIITVLIQKSRAK